MNDASYMKELFQIDNEARDAYINKMFAFYLHGKVRPGDSLFTLCLQDPLIYGAVMKRIQDHKKSSAVSDGKAQDSASEVQGRVEALRKDWDSNRERLGE